MSKVLIIEDDESLRDVYKEEFLNEGFSVETAVDGQEGIDKMTSFVPDVVLLDLLLPKVSGFDVLRIIKKDSTLKNIPILIITNINADAQDLLKNRGADYFLLKADNTPGDILEKAKMLLSRK